MEVAVAEGGEEGPGAAGLQSPGEAVPASPRGTCAAARGGGGTAALVDHETLPQQVEVWVWDEGSGGAWSAGVHCGGGRAALCCGRDAAGRASEGCDGEQGEGDDTAGGWGPQDSAARQRAGRCGPCACAGAAAAGAGAGVEGWAPGTGANGGCRLVRFGSVREAALVVQYAVRQSAVHGHQQQQHMQHVWQEQQQQQDEDQLLAGRGGGGGAAGTLVCVGGDAGGQPALELPLQQRLQAALGAVEGWAAEQGEELWRQLPAWMALGSMV